MVIAHNLAAMNSNRQFKINTGKKAKTVEKLASGYRINRAADDAAGLAISEKMRKQIRGLQQGVQNTQDGISLCQVADGALAEVHDMLQRANELAVQAANDTNSESDRKAIQAEVDALKQEVDRIAKTTRFNEKLIFQDEETNVREVISYNTGGNITEAGAIPFEDFVLADVDLGNTPFDDNSDAGYINLKTIVNNKDSAAYGQEYNLIYGNGNTSSSSFRITAQDGTEEIVKINELLPTNYKYDNTNKTWSRDIEYKNNKFDIVITQNVKLEEIDDGKEKNYIITYDFKNNAASKIDFEFLFHLDTAYNNNDLCEGYYTDGKRIENFCLYSDSASPLIDGVTDFSYIMKDTIPESFSIVDVDNALAFSEKVSFDKGTKPDTLSIGHYNEIHSWDYYNDALEYNLGDNAIRNDLGFSLYYNLDIENGKKETVTFRYGIIATDTDKNLKNITYKKDEVVIKREKEDEEQINIKQTWIQSGAESNDGIYIEIDKMNTKILGINNLDVLTELAATDSIDVVEKAINKLSKYRSKIGAQQNRLEHTVANENNIIENTTAAESRIRDTDMAKEVVRMSMQNILEQANTSIMAQTNQSNQGVLSLLNN